MFDIFIIGFVIISVAALVVTKDEHDTPEKVPQTYTEEQEE